MKKTIMICGLTLVSGVAITACQAPIKNANTDPDAAPNAQWADYKNFTKVTAAGPLTGSEGGPLGNVHEGPSGYRDIYVNDIALPMYESDGPYKYPLGSVIVKEQYKNETKWNEQKLGGLTVMVKLKEGTSPETADWGFASSYKGSLTASSFCFGCHAVGQADDYLFTNSKKIKALTD